MRYFFDEFKSSRTLKNLRFDDEFEFSKSIKNPKLDDIDTIYIQWFDKNISQPSSFECTSSEVTLSSLKLEFAPKLGTPQSLNSENNNCLFLKQVPSLFSINTALTPNHKTVAVPWYTRLWLFRKSKKNIFWPTGIVFMYLHISNLISQWDKYGLPGLILKFLNHKKMSSKKRTRPGGICPQIQVLQKTWKNISVWLRSATPLSGAAPVSPT